MTTKLMELSSLTVESQSLEQEAKGEKIFNGFAAEIKAQGMEAGELVSIGVLEGGTREGFPSVALLIRVNFEHPDGRKDSFFTFAECTGRNFLTASKIANVKVEEFIAKKQKNDSHRESMT